MPARSFSPNNPFARISRFRKTDPATGTKSPYIPADGPAPAGRLALIAGGAAAAPALQKAYVYVGGSAIDVEQPTVTYPLDAWMFLLAKDVMTRALLDPLFLAGKRAFFVCDGDPAEAGEELEYVPARRAIVT